MSRDTDNDYDPEDLYRDTGPDEMEKWLDACEEVKSIPRDRGGPGFGQWELEFIESIREQFDDRASKSKSPLSGKQLVKLRQLYDRI